MSSKDTVENNPGKEVTQSEAGKIDQLCLDETSLNVVSINREETKPTLSPAWYEYSPDGKVTDMALVDGLNHCFNEVRAISKLLMSAGDNADVVISGSAISQTAGILSDKMREADYFVELWRKANTDTK